MPSRKTWFRFAVEALEKARSGDPAALDLASYYYVADPRLGPLIQELTELVEFKRLRSSTDTRRAGQLMEQIAFLVFSTVIGASSIKSFQSAGPQYDLLVSGDTLPWLMLCSLLFLGEHHRSILVEAKAVAGRLPDREFARLCAIMETNLPAVGLGVFFTLSGASGFPDGSKRQRSIRDSRLRQVLYHAKTGKAVIVFDLADLMALRENGTLVEILIRKIRDISELSGLPAGATEELIEKDLPAHLTALI